MRVGIGHLSPNFIPVVLGMKKRRSAQGFRQTGPPIYNIHVSLRQEKQDTRSLR
jgi:hypothetical protein